MKEFVKASLSMPSILVLISALERVQKTVDLGSLVTVMSFNENFSDGLNGSSSFALQKAL